MFSLFFLSFDNANAEIKSIRATHTYNMGDNDSRNEARRICFLEAKRKVLEQAGTYIESRTEVRNYNLTKDEISAYSSALLRVETVNESWSNLSITIDVIAEVDKAFMEKQIYRIKRDASLQSEIKSRQDKIKQLEEKIVSMQNQIRSASVLEAAPLRKDRSIYFQQIDALEAKKIEIKNRIDRNTRNAKEHISQGMTTNDVQSLLGYRDGSEVKFYRGKIYQVWYYGHTSVYFNMGNIVEFVE